MYVRAVHAWPSWVVPIVSCWKSLSYVLSQHNTVPLNCAVTWPSDWSACSAECGLGVQTQTGVVTQKPSATGAPCPESLVRIRSCQLRNCLGTAILRSGAALGCSDIVNAQEKVVLGVALPASATAAAGRGLLEEQSDLTFVWSGGDGHLDLGDAEAVASWLLTPVTARQLAFKPRALQPGHTYNFACTVSNGVEQTTSKVDYMRVHDATIPQEKPNHRG